MNTASSISQIAALSGLGGNAPAAAQQHADVNIVLSTNSDFEDALQQVMHIASLSQTSSSQAPMRVAIEIQTPPGAIVNVYVSKQDDGYRAQLSTNDPQALSWVQDKMSTLRSSDLGVSVKWLPPQMESAATTTTGGGSNLGWERNNQNQPQYHQQQQQDERPQPQRRTQEEPALAGVSAADDFMTTFSSLQGVA